MQSVWKYELTITDKQVISMPKGAQLLTVQTQYETPQLWALVSPSISVMENRVIRIAGTGHPINSFNIEYIGTFQLQGGDFVAHVFEDKG